MRRIASVLAGVRKALGSEGLDLSLPVKPTPASRPRITRWRTYYGKNYVAFRDEVRKFLENLTKRPVEPYTGPLAVLTEIIGPKPKTTKRLFPRGDNDNYEKAIWDSITNCAQVWKDDDQIVLNVTSKRYACKHEQPGLKLTIYELEPNP